MIATLKRLAPRFWLLLLLVALGIGLTLIEQRGRLMSPTFNATSDGEQPDYYLENVEYTRFNAQGEADQTLSSPRIAHTPDDDVTRARSPNVMLLDSSGRHWHATGKQARLSGTDDTLVLTGDARLFEPDRQWRLETDTLHYDRNDRHAWSNSESYFHRGNQRTRGNRFDAWLDRKELVIDGDVHGYFPMTTQSDTP
ncbi:LPS export ABC transporter periplasmic protein LptC [Kushneria phosphatilytica]|uniref:LPS export ABC transporter periplasmic protein LptC n=1 Tax=Kushneria phosphatilytica TaxID=657387 RepID=A0A1S1NWB1_9GAMM|nr:LPS export ABC transporter periplasmic protein LptC [Kushneria phosphatilytica]OHV12251.1 LPS export ABC transporter periplasmic protein LptC [Kushneria phosphatilytica]QEL11453.1 LPS export ABC transporter periplasmic protein LptC [Kushneria phosphatilytica]